MRVPAEQFLTLRAFGAPPIVIALAAQGTFRGFMDTKTPLYAIGKLQHVSPISLSLSLVLCAHEQTHLHLFASAVVASGLHIFLCKLIRSGLYSF